MHSELNDLLENIKKDVREHSEYKKNNIFSDQNPALQVSVDDRFELWWYNLNKVLISLPYPENYHHRLVTELKEHGFTHEAIDKFQRDFPSKRRAVWWYSQSSIFYGILNRAFRQRNVRVLLLFGSFLQDLYRELKTEQRLQQQSRSANPTVKVYRGQVLQKADLEKLVNGYPIRSMALFSASTDRLIAEDFLIDSEGQQDVNRVLFEIEANYEHRAAMFSGIAKLSFFPNERETLFMANTTFLLQSRQERNDLHGLPSYWVVQLKLQSNYDMLRDRQLEAGSQRKTLKNCVNALSDMSEMICTFDDAIVFNVLMDIYPQEATWIRAIKLYSLAELEAQRCDDPRENKYGYFSAFSYYDEALAILEKYLADDDDELNCSFDVAENYLAMAQLYECGPPHLNNRSIPYLKKAVSFYELALQKCSATDYEGMGIVFKLRQVYRDLAKTDWEEYGSKAVSYQERWIELIMQDAIPSRPKRIAGEYQDLADRYAVIHRYEDALSHYKKALELYLSDNVKEESLPSVMDLYRKIVTVCTEQTHDFNSALHYELLRHKCSLKQLAEKQTAPSELWLNSLAESHFFVADCYINTRQFVPAYKHLHEGLAYMRQRKDLILKEGRLVIRAGQLVFTSDRQPLREPCSPDDKQLSDCDCKIKEKEEKLEYVQTLLESCAQADKTLDNTRSNFVKMVF